MPASGMAADSGHVLDAVNAINVALAARPKTIKINGTTKTVTSGSIDLGTIAPSLPAGTATGQVMTWTGSAWQPQAAPSGATTTIASTSFASTITN